MLHRRRQAPPECCGATVAPGTACPGCGRVPGRSRSTPTAFSAPGSSPPTSVTWASSEPPVLVAAPKPAKRPPRPRRKLRANPQRQAENRAADFGPLADAVRPLRCCVVGCDRTPVDPAHVVSRGAGGGAWIAVGGRVVGNLAPVCRGHHTGAPGFAREVIQHQAGLRAWQRTVKLAIKLPGQGERPVERLAEVAEAVGEWFKAGGRPETPPP